MKANALTLVHKYIRAELFDVSRLISSAGPEDVAAIQKAIDAVVELLHQHAEHEEAGFEPHIRERNAGFADRLVEEHRALHAELDAIVSSAHALDPDEPEACTIALLKLHLDWNRFVGGYLLHLDEEERNWFADADALMPPVTAMKDAPPGWSEEAHQAFLRKLFAAIAPGERAKVQGISD
ncbi:MAG: hemerythrin domain-containing protein [Proteobacteria bacterium]|nr:hemerythrin domain-containing protein [Pseudomonadota bacterium]